MEMVDTVDFEPTEMRLPRLLNLLRFGESIRVSESGDMLVTVRVQPGSELAGGTVADTLGRVRGLTAVAVIRQDNLLAPRGDTRFAEGDQLLAMTRPELHARLLQMAAHRPQPIEP
jgi:Trk K+ transport system NAD-binding subunit